MATYTELYQVSSDAALIERATVAAAISAAGINDEPADTPYHALRKRWASSVLRNPSSAGMQLIWVLIAQNPTLTVEQITGATDTAVQAAVDAAISLFIER